MRIINQMIASALMYATILLVNTTLAVAQEKQNDVVKSKISAFLDAREEMRDSSKYGFTSYFTGKLRSIPDEIQYELGQNFPEYKFYIAEMNVLIDLPLSKYDLILITDANTVELKGYVWANYWMLPPSPSFQTILKGHQAKSSQGAITQAKSLAKLIASVNHDEIGKAKIQNRKVKVEMLRGKNVSAILEVRINDCLQFESLAITAPNGNKLRRFVSELQGRRRCAASPMTRSRA